MIHQLRFRDVNVKPVESPAVQGFLERLAEKHLNHKAVMGITQELIEAGTDLIWSEYLNLDTDDGPSLARAVREMNPDIFGPIEDRDLVDPLSYFENVRYLASLNPLRMPGQYS